MKRLLPIALVLAALGLWLWIESSPGRAQELAPADVPATADRAPVPIEAAEAAPPARLPLDPPRDSSDTATEVVETIAPASGPAVADVLFHGLAVDGLSGIPIAGARAFVPRGELRFSADGLDPAGAGPAAISDAQGRFALALPSPGTLGRALLLSDGYGAAEFIVDAEHDSPERAVLVELVPAAELEVRVSDLAGRPVIATVEIAWPGEAVMRSNHVLSSSKRTPWSAATDAVGLARFTGLPAERELIWSLQGAERGTARDGRIALAPGERRHLDVVLGAGARLGGRVRDEGGVPVAGLRLRLVDSGVRQLGETRTDEQGGYEFVEVASGTFALALAPGSEFVVLGDTSVTVDRARIEHDLVVSRGLFIAGRVVGATEEGGMPKFVIVKHPDGSHVLSEVLDEAEFSVGPLAPGEYLVQASSGDSATAVVRASAGASDVELPMVGARTISIRVENPADEFAVTVLDLERGVTRFSDDRGSRFEFRYAHGSYAVLLTTSDGRIGFLRLVVDAEHPAGEVTIALETGAVVTVVHEATAGVRKLRIRVAGEPFPLAHPLREDLTAGASATLLLPAGPVELELVEQGRVVAREEALLFAGEHRRIVLVPP